MYLIHLQRYMNKKLKIVTTIMALCIGLILVGTKAYATTAITLNDNTRLRKKASTSSEIVEVIDKDEKLEVVSKEDDWYKVKYKSYVGYIRGDLLDIEEEKKEETSKSDETKKEETSKTDEAKTEETNKENETKKEETAKQEESSKESKVEIKENDQIELKNETQLQLLPIIFSCKTGKISANTKITVEEIVGKWCRISASNQEGWVLTSKIENNKVAEQKVEEKEENKEEAKKEETENKETKLYVSTTTLNLREKADTKSDIVTQLNLNDEVTVVKVIDDTWTQVKFKNYEGYTASEYLSNKKSADTTSRSAQEIRNSEEEKKKEEEAKQKAAEEAKKKAEEAAKKKAAEEAKKKQEEEEEEEKTTSKASTSSKKSGTTGEDIVAYAKKFLGYKYVYGASGPNSFDCSGFTSYVYKHFGYSLNRTSGGQRSNGTGVSKSDLEPGDIVCFSGHVGIYIGGNKFIHAANPKKGVIISSLSESYYVKTYITARRIL